MPRAFTRGGGTILPPREALVPLKTGKTEKRQSAPLDARGGNAMLVAMSTIKLVISLLRSELEDEGLPRPDYGERRQLVL